MTKVKQLIEEFKNMNLSPMFEIEDAKNEYDIYYINCTDEGLEAGGCANIGFLHIDKDSLFVEWDEDFSLDEHLQELYSLCIEYSTN